MKWLIRSRHLALALGFACLALTGPAVADTTANYHCQDGSVFVASFSPPGDKTGSADLSFADGRRFTLAQALSADGGRYVDGDTEFWIKGDAADLTSDGKATKCRTIE